MGCISTGIGDRLIAQLVFLMTLQLTLVDRYLFWLCFSLSELNFHANTYMGTHISQTMCTLYVTAIFFLILQIIEAFPYMKIVTTDL